VISFAQNRRNRGLWQSASPSRFVDELPEPNVEVLEARTPYEGAALAAGRFNPYGRSRFEEPAAGFASSYQTPGWQRAQQRAGREDRKSPVAPMLEGELVASSGRAGAGLLRGERVFHQKFGYGRVADVDGNKLTIDFEKAGRKRVLDNFVARAEQA